MSTPNTAQSTSGIQSKEDVFHYLYVAMQLEHATIPPYLMGLYTIKPGTNQDAAMNIREVVVEEMLHLTLAANILNAVGGTPDLTCPGFVPTYPARLPDGENDFTVSLQPFSKAALKTFLQIERPAKPKPKTVNGGAGRRMLERARALSFHLGPRESSWNYYSIGEFYTALAEGLKHLAQMLGEKELFNGPVERQVGPEVYYSGGGKVVKVVDLATALQAIDTIIEQGEGYSGRICNEEGELAHEYRFEQLLLGRAYKGTDTVGNPTGDPIQVDWTAAYPVKVDAKLSDYEGSPELHAAALAFNQDYAEFLSLITQAFQKDPRLLISKAVPWMFQLRNRVNQLVHNPIPGTSFNAAPTFEMASASVAEPAMVTA
jgi:hypothetical protein